LSQFGERRKFPRVQAFFRVSLSLGDDEEKVTQAKKHLTWASLGLLLIILSYAAVKIIVKFVYTVASNVS